MKRIAISLLILLSCIATAAIEDFTTYTEVDTVGNRIAVTSNKVTVTAIPRDETCYVYKDYGAGYFKNSWKHRFILNTTVGEQYGWNNPWLICNSVSNAKAKDDAAENWIALRQGSEDGTSPSIRITDWVAGDGTNTDVTANSTLTDGATYYITLQLKGGTLTCYICSNSHYDKGGTLVDTLTVSSVNSVEYRYIYAACSYNAGTGQAVSGYIQDLDLNYSRGLRGRYRGNNRARYRGKGRY